MNEQNSRPKNWFKLSGIIFLIIGLILLIFMVTFEEEPGALPLLMIVIGITTLIVNSIIKKRI